MGGRGARPEWRTDTESGGARHYDRAGRLTAEDFGELYGWRRWLYYDWTGRLSWTEKGMVFSGYVSDPLGRPNRNVSWGDGGPGDPVYRIHSGAREIEERDSTGEVVHATYVHGSGIDEVVQSTRGWSTYWHHTDDLGSALCLTDESGQVVERYDYEDYGWPKFSTPEGNWRGGSLASIGNPFLFNGRRWDPLAEQYDYRTRRLDPRAGRFTSRDLIGTWGDAANLGNQNSYVGNNPWSGTDPWGGNQERSDQKLMWLRHPAGESGWKPLPLCSAAERDTFTKKFPGT